jgi:hypothetical protein
LRWLSTQPGTVARLSRHDGSAEEQTELPEPVVRHFDETGYRGLLFGAAQLDDQGRVGLLLYEAAIPISSNCLTPR